METKIDPPDKKPQDLAGRMGKNVASRARLAAEIMLLKGNLTARAGGPGLDRLARQRLEKQVETEMENAVSLAKALEEEQAKSAELSRQMIRLSEKMDLQSAEFSRERALLEEQKKTRDREIAHVREELEGHKRSQKELERERTRQIDHLIKETDSLAGNLKDLDAEIKDLRGQLAKKEKTIREAARQIEDLKLLIEQPMLQFPSEPEPAPPAAVEEARPAVQAPSKGLLSRFVSWLNEPVQQ